MAERGDSRSLSRLTSQELQIARFVAQGLSNREVAARLFLSPRTIEAQLRRIFGLLGTKIAGDVRLALQCRCRFDDVRNVRQTLEIGRDLL